MSISRELLANHYTLATSIDKPRVVTGDFTFLSEKGETTSVEHRFCAAMVAINAAGNVLVAHVYPHLYPGKEFDRLALRGPRALNDDFVSVYILLQHLFFPQFSPPQALVVLSEQYKGSFWRGFEVAAEIMQSDELVAEYAAQGIAVQAWLAFVEQIQYLDLVGEHRPYDVQVVRSEDRVQIETVGRGSDSITHTV